LIEHVSQLQSQGVPHDEAVRRALAEFGDAAALAASFSELIRIRRRRLIMRVTFGSVLLLAAMTVGIVAFRPQVADDPQVVVAQDAGEKKPDEAKKLEAAKPEPKKAVSGVPFGKRLVIPTEKELQEQLDFYLAMDSQVLRAQSDIAQEQEELKIALQVVNDPEEKSKLKIRSSNSIQSLRDSISQRAYDLRDGIKAQLKRSPRYEDRPINEVMAEIDLLIELDPDVIQKENQLRSVRLRAQETKAELSAESDSLDKSSYHKLKDIMGSREVELARAEWSLATAKSTVRRKLIEQFLRNRNDGSLPGIVTETPAKPAEETVSAK